MVKLSINIKNGILLGGDYNFTYDPTGNRKTFSHMFGTEQYTYANNCNKLMRKKINLGNTFYSYDKNGNLTSETQMVINGRTKQINWIKRYEWTAENRLTVIYHFNIIKIPELLS